MKRAFAFVSAVILATVLTVAFFGGRSVSASYTYFYIGSLGNYGPSWLDWFHWGSIVATLPPNSCSCGGVMNDSYNPYNMPGTLLYSGASGSGEVKLTIRGAAPNNPSTFIAYLDATQDTPGTYSSYTYVSITGSTLSVGQSYQSSNVLLASTTINAHDNLSLRAVKRNDGLIVVYVDNSLSVVTGSYFALSGYKGLGISNYAGVIQEADFGYLDTIAPNAIPSGNIGVSAFATHVDLQWPAATDNANGTGILFYQVLRNGQLLTTTTGTSFSDTTVAPTTTYSYTLNTFDYHLNYTGTTINVTTPHVPTNPPFPSSVPDGRRVGVRTTGAYWGAGSEQIDVLSGNVNYSIPLLTAIGRGGSGVGFNLTYNSQNWRKDSGGTWQFGQDVGFGYGWKLMAGSITPVWSNPYTASYYLFTDSTGAQYRLDQNSNNVWTSKESVYVSFDANTNVLYFRDGTHWTFGCVSATTEQDSGVMYPTYIEDTNGNAIFIYYNYAAGANWGASSSRISMILDVRGVYDGNGNYPTYLFSYTTFSGDSIPHLTSITNTIGSSDAYTFSYTASALASPISPYTGFGNTRLLSSVTTQGINTSNQFVYGSNNAGELTKAILPYGGYLSWDYSNVAYTSGVTYREVAHRFLSKDGSSNTTTYQFSHEASPGANVRQYTILDDPGGVGEKYWAFGQSGVSMGLLTTYQGRSRPGPVTLQQSDLTWAQDAVGNSYVSSALQKFDPGQTYEADKKVDQALDTYGNVTQVKQYNFGNLTTPARTYNYTYLNSSAYTSRYIFNRMTQASVTAGSTNTTLVTNSYDQGNPVTTNGPSRNWNSGAYWNVTTRGSLTTSTTVDGAKTIAYDIVGNPKTVAVNSVTVNVTTAGSTNYAVPTALTSGLLTETINWTAALAQSSSTGPNGDTSTATYDVYGRPTGGTSPFGAASTITYNSAPYSLGSPATVTATINGRWTRNTLDGLGRTIKAEAGDAGATKTVAESVYGSCGCSPTGKLMQQAVPHAPGATPAYTTYTYDGIGRTLTAVAPDGASTTTYLYKGNTVKVTDPAGKWKLFTTDAMGNLSQVEEPNPAGGASYFTSYTYDVLNNLLQVSMPRPSGTQTRTFVYNGRNLTSATNPENGAVSYTYNSYNKVATKTDAKGQQIVYTYDTLARPTKVQRYPQGPSGSEDVCQQENYSYDTNPYDGSFSLYPSGRLTAVQYKGGYDDGTGTPNCNTTFTEMYSYSQAGGTLAKRLRTARTRNSTTSYVDLEGDYTYDNEGRVTGVQYPSSSLPFAVSAPTFSPAPGTYSSAQTVTMSTTTSGASIRYTTDGSTPTSTTGTLYSGPIAVSNTQTIKAIAYKTAMPNSAISSGPYTIPTGAAWYNASWTNRKLVTIDHTKVSGGANLTNFPMLFSVTDANLKTVANGGGVGKTDGTDILFTSSDGVTKLNHEIELYNGSTGQVVAWVSVPTLSASLDTKVYIYYGNAAASNQQNPTGVWDSSSAGVWHMKDNAASTAVTESTSNANNGTSQGNTSTKTTAGKIGSALTYNGTSDYVSLPNAASLNVTGPITISMWIKTASNNVVIMGGYQSGGSYPGYGLGLGVMNTSRLDFYSSVKGAWVSSNSTGYNDNNWHHLAVAVNGTSLTFYKDGVADGTPSSNNPGSYSGTRAIGSLSAGAGYFTNGVIDEVRISSAARSAGWIGSEYNNQSSPGTFYSVSGAESSGGAPAQAVAPAFSPAPGDYNSTQTVTMSTATSGASVRYTTDGSTPTQTHGTLYSGAVSVGSATTINAIAYKSGLTDSPVTSGTYTFFGGGSTPSPGPGPHLGTAYDTMGRPSTLTNLATSSAIISGTTYGPANQLLTMSGQVTETRTYNSMLQLTSLNSSNTSGGAVNITYAYSGTQNNGKITSQTDSISGEQVVYTYDALNRLATAQATSNSWGQGYSYDGFGNLTDQNVIAGSAPTLHVVYSAATNRQTSECADANGNLGSASACSGTTTNYDVENRIVSPNSANQWQYSYAPGNKRVWRGVWTSGAATDEVTFWGVDGQKLGTWSLLWYTGQNPPQLYATMTGCNYYFGGRMIKNAGGYVAADRLGSIGKFYPYGQEKPSATANGKEKFTGYFRDAETGLDYADQRYHQPGMGRFMTPDPNGGSAGPNDPGSWNRYAYVGGDPANRTDPEGLCYQSGGSLHDDDGKSCNGFGGNGPGGSITVYPITPTLFWGGDTSLPNWTAFPGGGGYFPAIDISAILRQGFLQTQPPTSTTPPPGTGSTNPVNLRNPNLDNGLFVPIGTGVNSVKSIGSDIQDFLVKTAIVPNFTLTLPLPDLPMLGAQFEITYIPKTQQICGSFGLALSPTIAAGATTGFYFDPTNAAPKIMPGPSVGVTLQMNAGTGVQAVTSFGQPVIAGPVFGLSGTAPGSVTVNSSYGGCK